MKQFFYTGLAVIFLATACQPDTRNNRYDNWDTNQNSGIDDQEFEQAFTTSPYYDQWNDDDNRMVSRSEFTQGFFQMIDKDNDGALSEQEWQHGKESYFSDAVVDNESLLDGLDQNNDRVVQSAEFQKMLDDVDYFSKWDKDGNSELDEPEVAKGVFSMWDTDGNGVIEAAEYELWDNTP
ncbi:MAG: hypothetical protein WBA23_10055 [Tunicatimonas sp.]|uniref:hypothetical protein n=1 Tax=Tunicatimonas sp. TaxID=1940096 RepID=UPI003C718F2A